MLVIRLQRTGRENTPTFRIVVSEKARSAKKGQHEIIGHFLNHRAESVFKCDTERVAYWVSKGAQPSDTVARLLQRNGMKGMEKFIVRYAKQKSKNPEEAAPAPAPVAAATAPEAAPAAEAPAPEAAVAPAETPAA
ncbi:MAG: 30S ribosomal protein S16 [Candidatus Peribacteraceae bacterium]|nr:30S ribosomal protein S16 [Candidatus Peribacteraceae bacterium]